MATDYGNDVLCTTDLDPLMGEVNGQALLAQDIKHRLETMVGSLAFLSGDSTFGYDILLMLNSDFRPIDITRFQALISNQVTRDERIFRADVSITLVQESESVQIKIVCYGASKEKFEFVFSLGSQANLTLLTSTVGQLCLYHSTIW